MTFDMKWYGVILVLIGLRASAQSDSLVLIRAIYKETKVELKVEDVLYINLTQQNGQWAIDTIIGYTDPPLQQATLSQMEDMLTAKVGHSSITDISFILSFRDMNSRNGTEEDVNGFRNQFGIDPSCQVLIFNWSEPIRCGPAEVRSTMRRPVFRRDTKFVKSNPD